MKTLNLYEKSLFQYLFNTVLPINQTNPVPPNPIIAYSNGIGSPTFDAPDGSLMDDEFVVEINGTIDETNTTGSPAATLADGDLICVSAFTYDLVAINSTLNSINLFCGFADCDLLLGGTGAEQAISDLVAGRPILALFFCDLLFCVLACGVIAERLCGVTTEAYITSNDKYCHNGLCYHNRFCKD